ncbi:MAG: arsenosugar biosynthesis radical SAM protein ArsS [Saprospiraceae bacterium]|nr:arsenosugar biosynthesis radical SAM protein ArsS [Saprospiraceae bacterium]
MGVKQRSTTLSSAHHLLASPVFQLEVLNGASEPAPGLAIPPFVVSAGMEIRPRGVEVLQINIGKLCNQSCAHCHVDAGPDRKHEQMTQETMQLCLDFAIRNRITTIDITGGAPEMNVHFRWLVEACREAGIQVINRCNLTIIMSNPRFRDLPEFFARNKVHIISSLPHFSKTRTDHQRGDGVFEDSIAALKLLNQAGYGFGNPDYKLDLVYNPSGAFLPGSQHTLEKEFKAQLIRRFGVSFDHLFTITNLPVSRFLDYLLTSGNYTSYMEELYKAFNPSNLEGLMCRFTLSVGWDGFLYDCDFNQMLNLKSNVAHPHISTADAEELLNRQIVVNQHCYGCTAGAGSSCGGEISA